MIGQVVGRFRILAKLGEGGMGIVWRAEDPLLGRSVALKLMRESVDGEQARRRFLREARATSALDHPGIAKVFDVGDHEGRLFIAIAFVDGDTIHKALSGGPLPLREAVRLAAEAAEALEHAHTRGIIHRDISARNIMRARDGRAVVIDFGIAALRGATRLTSAGVAMGTLPYTAPEILRNEPATRLSDLYSLGVVLYEMVTGRLPYAGDQQAAIVYALLNSKLAPPRSHRPEISAPLDRLIVRLLAREPVRRIPSAAELAARLRALRVRATATRPTTLARGVSPTAETTPLRRRAGTSGPPSRRLLAVLPFRSPADALQDSGLSELALGLAETLSAGLARVPRLQVFPPGQQVPLADDESARTAARRMGATLLLRGSVRRDQDRIHVSYSLVDSRRGLQVAGDRLDGDARDLLALEDALVGSVLRSLQVRAHVGRRASQPDAAGHESYLRALGHLQRRDSEQEMDRAIELLEGLIESEGDTAPVHAALARGYLRKAALAHQPQWRARAEASCRIALRLDPHSAEVLVTLAKLKLETGKVEEAIEAVQRSLSLQSQNVEAWLCLAYAHEVRGQFAEAEHAALEAERQQPGYWPTQDRLALIYFRWGRFENAADRWKQVVRTVPGHSNAGSNLGAALFHLGRFDEAAAAYRSSLELNPQASAYTGLGTVLFFAGQREAALGMFEKAVALRPEDPRAWANLGDAQRWTEGRQRESACSFERAEGLLRRQMAAGNDHHDTHSQLARVLSKRGRPAESIEEIERSLALAPGNVSGLARAVTVFHLAGDRERATQYLRSALAAGYSRIELRHDPELEELCRHDEVQELLKDGSTTSARTTAPFTRGGR